jgi:hypothetical protein
MIAVLRVLYDNAGNDKNIAQGKPSGSTAR